MIKKNKTPAHIFIFPLMPKNCPKCEMANPPSAIYCGYCGNAFPVTRIRQSDDVTRNSDRTH